MINLSSAGLKKKTGPGQVTKSKILEESLVYFYGVIKKL
jgi:hypothetical protein